MIARNSRDDLGPGTYTQHHQQYHEPAPHCTGILAKLTQ
jgi:hypothetical protein